MSKGAGVGVGVVVGMEVHAARGFSIIDKTCN